jgi:peptidoglycan/LPS O-acetylase OafA/YrhL
MKRQELPALTALRFPAAFAIVLFHYLAEAKNIPAWLFQNLSEGVSFFYVLSGFILCYNYPELSDKKGFWIARFARIWPVHLVTLILVLVALPFFHILGHASWPITLPLNFLLLQSWLPWKGSMLSFNGVSWSLCVEAYFYFCFPWLLILFRRWGGALLLAACFLQGLTVAAVGQLAFGWPHEYTSFFPACRLFEFALGMQACRLWQDRAPGKSISPLHEILSLIVGLIFVMGVATLVLKSASPLPLVPWFVTEISAFFFAWIIWTFAHHAGPVSRALSMPLAVQLGQVSFSLYMFHQIVQRFLQVYGYDTVMPPAAAFVIYLTVSMIGAYLLFYAVENPARHWIVGAYRRAVAGRVTRASSSSTD